jgi:hypothetical protein
MDEISLTRSMRHMAQFCVTLAPKSSVFGPKTGVNRQRGEKRGTQRFVHSWWRMGILRSRAEMTPEFRRRRPVCRRVARRQGLC